MATRTQEQHEAYARETATHVVLTETEIELPCYYRKNEDGEWEGILRFRPNDDWCTGVDVDQETLDLMVGL